MRSEHVATQHSSPVPESECTNGLHLNSLQSFEVRPCDVVYGDSEES